MKKISIEEGFGIVSEDFEPACLAREILKLNPEQIHEKKLAAKNFSQGFNDWYSSKTFLDFLGVD